MGFRFIGLSTILSALVLICEPKALANELAESLTTPPFSCMSDAEAAQPALHMRQIPFEAGASKRVILIANSAESQAWVLKDKDGHIVGTGLTDSFGRSPASNQPVHQIDIGALQPGSGYRLSVCGQEGSAFDVASQPYSDLAEDALRYFYLNRAGIPIETQYSNGDQWARAAGHTDERVTCYSGPDKWGTRWPECATSFDVSGGWYDAGDFGKYTVPAGHTVWMLLNAYERMQSDGGIAESGWDDGRVNLPETGNGLSELLNEARWGIEWMLSMQVPEGTQLNVPIGDQVEDAPLQLTEIDASNLAFSKVHERNWLGFPLLPENANETRFAYYPTTAATLNVAGIGAMCARLWRNSDLKFSNRCLRAATEAYEAAKQQPDIYAYNNFDGGGPYDDTDLSDEFAWAATELFLTTGQSDYIGTLSTTPGKYWLKRMQNQGLNDLSWSKYDLQPAMSLLANSDPISDSDRQRAKAVILSAAKHYLTDGYADAYHVPFPVESYGWGSNGALASRGIVLAYAYEISGQSAYRQAATAIMDYLTGRNPLGQSYVAGYGTQAVQHVHHRFWAEGKDTSFPPAAPGALSGGPNANYPAEDIAKQMAEAECAPQACWSDHVDAYSLNEVAIYWNSALFWLASYLDATSISQAASLLYQGSATVERIQP